MDHTHIDVAVITRAINDLHKLAESILNLHSNLIHPAFAYAAETFMNIPCLEDHGIGGSISKYADSYHNSLTTLASYISSLADTLSTALQRFVLSDQESAEKFRTYLDIF